MDLFPPGSVVSRVIKKVEANNISSTLPPLDVASRLYYEAHITVEPIRRGTVEWDTFNDVATEKGWHVSSFTQDGAKDFVSLREQSLRTICEKVGDMVRTLQRCGFTVLRWKVEDTLFDSKSGDVL